MIVVCDASPLFALLAVRQERLLETLYNEVIVPVTVQREVEILSRNLGTAEEIAIRLNFVRVAHAKAYGAMSKTESC